MIFPVYIPCQHIFSKPILHLKFSIQHQIYQNSILTIPFEKPQNKTDSYQFSSSQIQFIFITHLLYNKFIPQKKSSIININLTYSFTKMKDQPFQQIQHLLITFNKFDQTQQGLISLLDAQKIIKQKISINSFNPNILNKVIFKTNNFVTFDQFLSLLHETQLDTGLHSNHINTRMLQFLKLLNQYRKRCQQSSMYTDAQNAYLKALDTQSKQIKRNQHKLLLQQKYKVSSISQLQQSKLLQFNDAWNQYIQKYEHAAQYSLTKLKKKYRKQLQIQQDRMRSFYQNTYRPSKKIYDLKNKQKQYVKHKMYTQAQKIKCVIQKLQIKQKQQLSLTINQKIKRRKQMIKKHQQATLIAYVQKIQKGKTNRYKKRSVDLSKMYTKLQNLHNNIIQKQQLQIQQTLQDLRLKLFLSTGQFLQYLPHIMHSFDKISNKSKISIINIQTTPCKYKHSYKSRIKSYHSSLKEDPPRISFD